MPTISPDAHRGLVFLNVMEFFIKTYGCQMNTHESEKVTELLQSLGLVKTLSISDADMIIINSCSVRQAAEDSVYGLGKIILKMHSKPTVVLMGCLTGAAKGPRRRYEISYLKDKAPFIDHFLTYQEVLEELPKLVKGSWIPCLAGRQACQEPSSGLVSISQGCNNFCSYCIVPYSRGPEKSRSFEEIFQEVENIIKSGQTEIMLLGQNVNSWGKDLRSTFANLLKVLHEIPGLTKLSFLTSNPYDFGDDLIEALKLPKIDRYLHLPVQSGDSEVLRRMNRRYTREEFLELVKRIKIAVPEIRIGTDIIVGFPGETEEQFQNTLDLIRQVEFRQIFLAKYSPRKGTVSAETMVDDVPLAVKRRRHKEVLELSKKLGHE